MAKTETIRKAVTLGALLTPLALSAAAVEGSGTRVTLPSGAVVYWQETRHDNSGGMGLTARFRFVMPDLAQRVPSTSGPASDFAEEEPRGPIDIDTESGEVTGDGTAGAAMDQPADQAADQPESKAPDMPDDGTEQAADAQIDRDRTGVVLTHRQYLDLKSAAGHDLQIRRRHFQFQVRRLADADDGDGEAR